ncbi:MAG: hypothetical protein ABWY64_13315 [Tardiphaga sp.]
MISAARRVRYQVGPLRRRPLTDAERKRDPTRSNDLRRRIATGLRRNLAMWRSQVYAAVVEADALRFDMGEVDTEHIDEVIDRLDVLLHRQAEFAFSGGADRMDIDLRTAYARGVTKAGEELTPTLPLTGTPVELITQARGDLEFALEEQIAAALDALQDEKLAAAALKSRHKLYAAVLLPLLIRPAAKRLNAVATTNVTRAFNAGKIDAYSTLGIYAVGVEAETQPARRPRGEEALEQIRAEQERIRERFRTQQPTPPTPPMPPMPPGEPPWEVWPEALTHFPETYTVETVGDDKVCAICESYEGNSYTLAEARDLIPAHPNCRCAVVPLA